MSIHLFTKQILIRASYVPGLDGIVQFTSLSRLLFSWNIHSRQGKETIKQQNIKQINGHDHFWNMMWRGRGRFTGEIVRVFKEDSDQTRSFQRKTRAG